MKQECLYRLTNIEKQAVMRVANELGLTPSSIVLILVKSFLKTFDRSHGMVEFPIRMKSQAEALNTVIPITVPVNKRNRRHMRC
jgi:hypothetical protein